MAIDKRFIDVPGDGTAFERDDKLGDQFTLFEDSIELIPRSDWRELIETYDYENNKKLDGRIKRQTMGSCASHSSTSCLETLRNKAVGKEDYIELSPLSVYKFVGSGPNSGSSLSANMRRLSQVGVLPVDNAENRERFDHVWPENKWDGRLPSGYEETAKLFRLTEWYEIESFDGMMTAMLRNLPVYYGRSGHAIKSSFPAYRSGFIIGYQNSWDESWGDGGYGFDTERFVSGSIRSYGCYVPRVGTLLPIDQMKVKNG